MDLVDTLKVKKAIATLDRDPFPKSWNADIDGLMRNHPETYLSAVESLGSGQSLKGISVSLKLPLRTIRAIKERHPSCAESYQEAVKRNLEEGIHLLTELLVEKADEIPAAKLGLNIHLLNTNHQLLTGQATSRHEHVNVPTPEDLQKLFDQLPEAKAEIKEC
jgi:hypothetical protein